MTKQVTIWGGSGFIGSNVCDYFTKNNFKVIVADSKKSKFLNKKQKMFTGNINNFNDVLNSLKGSQYVFNFAGLADINESNDNPIDLVNSNIMGNINILEACKKNKIKKYVFASTIYIYSKFGGLYKSSKQSCELFVKEYEKLFGLKYNILRFGTVYGPRSNNNNAITSYLNNALNNKLIKIFSDKNIIREYIHVYDVAKSCLKIIDKKYDNKDYILTGSYQIRIGDLIELISEILNKKLKIKYLTKSNHNHYKITPYSFQPNLSEKLTITPSTDLGQGILDLVYSIKKKNY
jgi:UDP-glucose 4-epimerase